VPGRIEPLLKNNIYHVFNRAIGDLRVFGNVKIYGSFLDRMRYYRSSRAYSRFSNLKDWSVDKQKEIWKIVGTQKYFRVDILGYSLMPNHFHFLLCQKTAGGISNFISDLLNSFTRYYNTKNGRKGPIFLTKFKAVKILSDEQLTHVLRYILLNPYSSGIVNNLNNLMKYSYSSFKEHLEDPKARLTTDKYILPLFENDRNRFKEFVLDNAEYQRTIEHTKHTEHWYK